MRTRILAVAAAFSLTFVIAGCGDDDDTASDADTGSDDTEETTDEGDGDDEGGSDDSSAGDGDGGVIASGFEFLPHELTVAAGESFTFTNEDSSGHTFTIDDADIDEEVAGGDSADITAPAEAGDYEWRCRFHSNMQGTLTVE